MNKDRKSGNIVVFIPGFVLKVAKVQFVVDTDLVVWYGSKNFQRYFGLISLSITLFIQSFTKIVEQCNAGKRKNAVR